MTTFITTLFVMATLWVIAFICYKSKKTFIGDKTMHVYTLWIIVDYVGLFSFLFTYGLVAWPICLSLLIAVVAGIAAIYGKEYIIDKKLGWGTFSKDDIKFGWWGLFIGLTCLVPLIDLLLVKQMAQ